jgi:hypothetical protein
MYSSANLRVGISYCPIVFYCLHFSVCHSTEFGHSIILHKLTLDFKNRLNLIKNMSAETGQNQESLYV